MKRLISISIIAILLMGIIALAPVGKTDTEAYTSFQDAGVDRVVITASALNVRSGNSTGFPVVDRIYRDQVIEVIGKLGNWYVVHLPNDTVGAVASWYTKPYVEQQQPPSNNNSYASQEEQYMLQLINQEREKAGLSPLKMDKDLVKLARLKSQDMIDYNYFSHTSPTYGSPFQMMNDFGIQYRYAGENIAGNRSVDSAHQALMNSSGHRANILNANYNYIGIGIVDGGPYGKMFTQMFVGR